MQRNRIGILLLLLAGVLLCSMGCARWWRSYEASRVVNQFLAAATSGNVAASLDALHPTVRETAERRANERSATAWQADPTLRFRVMRTTFSHDLATVEARLEKDGYVIRPQFLLERDDQRQWKIVQIDGLKIDPLWADRENRRADQEGDELFRELEHALAGSPAIDSPPAAPSPSTAEPEASPSAPAHE